MPWEAGPGQWQCSQCDGDQSMAGRGLGSPAQHSPAQHSTQCRHQDLASQPPAQTDRVCTVWNDVNKENEL